ncbi:hypothetical protein D9M71_388780 [compost metagenome]
MAPLPNMCRRYVVPMWSRCCCRASASFLLSSTPLVFLAVDEPASAAISACSAGTTWVV